MMSIANVVEHCIKMQIPEISKLNEIWSPKILIHGIPWQVKVCKEEGDKQPSLGVYLYCAIKDQTNWSLWGAVSFKLLSFNEKVEPVEYHCSALVFDRSELGYGEPKFILWNDLFDKAKNYVKNDTIQLELNVKAENPKDPNRNRLNFECIDKCCESGSLANFRLTVTNVANLMAARSPKFKLRGLMWQVQILKHKDSDLVVLLQLKEESDEVSCKMSMSIKLVSSKKDVHPIEKCDTKQYDQLMELNIVEVVSWDELMKPENGFVNNDSITLEIEFTSHKPEIDGIGVVPNAKQTKLNLTNECKSVHMECAICLECIENQDLASTPCGHLFCFDCIKKEVTNRGKCPTCTTPVQKNNLRQLYLPVVN